MEISSVGRDLDVTGYDVSLGEETRRMKCRLALEAIALRYR
jgi:hypothetical protein